ncbi:hypothetical protein [Actinomadura napierensis]|uniref:Uncharacterized protein n=1 Tax=Actinomadura napierensis TaxID=267854 RepID=A0ABP5K9M9_9ACTN
MTSAVDGRALDVRAVRLEIERRYPGVTVWFGETTFRWWAMVWCGTWRLLEASTPRGLVGAIESARPRRASLVR